jgi:polyphosphate kinase
VAAPTISEQGRYLDRELSWLAFNRRVLELSEDPVLPLLERAKFLAIFGSNLDEFFQIRVAGLKDKIVGASLEAASVLKAVGKETRGLLRRHGKAYRDVESLLGGAGLAVVASESLTASERSFLAEYFESRVFPILTPLAVDPAHPFPYISDLALSFGIVVERPDGRRAGFARVKVPPNLPRLVELPGGGRYVYLEDVIGEHLETLFPGSRIVTRHVFRVTRDADLDIQEDEADDLLAAVEVELLQRRLGRAVRLEVEAGTPDMMLQLLLEELELEPDDVYVVDGRLDPGGLWQLWRLERPDLKDDPWPPIVPRRLAGAEGDGVSIFDEIRRGDLVVHHPYESFSGTVGAFLQQAATDPGVLGIKMTLYRTSGDSPIVAALIRAAEEGKQVVALIELKARFDERNNIAWAKALDRAGAHVVYGIVGLKTHAKAVLVVRTEGGRLTRYCHFGTGNYNPATARTYEDLGLLTADAELGAELAHLFNGLTGFGASHRYQRLAVAPEALRSRVLELIAEQVAAGNAGRILMKLNSLVDEEIIDALYAASGAGTSVDLVVRGTCCLRPGVAGLSEHIRVRSIVGRFLEHSRVFAFGEDAEPLSLTPVSGANGRHPHGGEPSSPNGSPPRGAGGHLLIGSADLMPRNLDRRVEVLVPIDDPVARRQVRRILHNCLADDTNAWELAADGTWRRLDAATGCSSQRVAYEDATARAAPVFASRDA